MEVNVSEERGRWLIIGCIAVPLLLDFVLMVLDWRFLPKPEPWTHLIRMLITGLVGICLYRGHRWARWYLIVGCAAVVVYGIVRGSVLFHRALAHNPFALMSLLGVLVGAVVGSLLLASADIKQFQSAQRVRHRR
jgi:fatty-acid desaturase